MAYQNTQRRKEQDDLTRQLQALAVEGQEINKQYKDGYSFDDYANTAQYQREKNRYSYNGSQAMRDTLGQMAARTGGLASSYAQNAGQQTYQNWMAQFDAQAQQGYQNELSRWQNQMNAALNDNATRYARLQDRLAASRAADETEYARWQQARQEAQERLMNYYKVGGTNIDPTLLKESGYTQSEINALMNYYNQLAAANSGYSAASSNSRKSSEGKKSSEKTSDSGGSSAPDVYVAGEGYVRAADADRMKQSGRYVWKVDSNGNTYLMRSSQWKKPGENIRLTR